MHEARIRLMSYQKELLKSSNPFTFAVMGRGSGKTYTLSVIALMKLLQGENLILCAQRYDSLRDVLMKDVKLRAKEWGLDGMGYRGVTVVRVAFYRFVLEPSCGEHDDEPHGKR